MIQELRKKVVEAAKEKKSRFHPSCQRNLWHCGEKYVVCPDCGVRYCSICKVVLE